MKDKHLSISQKIRIVTAYVEKIKDDEIIPIYN